MRNTPLKAFVKKSPLKIGGLVAKVAKTGYKVAKKATTPTGATITAATDKTKNRSTAEKILRGIDEYGPTLGLGAYIYDRRNKTKKVYKDQKPFMADTYKKTKSIYNKNKTKSIYKK